MERGRLDAVSISGGRKVRVVRHDLVEGGTKRLVLPSVLESCYRQEMSLRISRPDRLYVYASPSFGYAQLAIAVACRDLGYKSSLFVPSRKSFTQITLAAKRVGASIHKIDPGYLVVCQKRARDYAKRKNGVLLPFGLQCERMVQGIADLARSLRIRPKEVWIASASGTLWRGLAMAWPNAFFQVVQPGKKQNTDWATYHGIKFRIWQPKEKFHQEARDKPPYPSAANYDAKIWQFAKQHARDGALIWNVAG